MDDEEPKNDLKAAEGFAETLKRLVGLIVIFVEALSALDPTFGGLLWINPPIAGEAFPFAFFVSILLALAVVIINWKHLQERPDVRPIDLKRNLIGLILSGVGLAILLNLTVSYQAGHPPETLDSAFWRRHLLHAEYILFVTLTVFFLTRIALRLYPQRKKESPLSNQPQQLESKKPVGSDVKSSNIDHV